MIEVECCIFSVETQKVVRTTANGMGGFPPSANGHIGDQGVNWRSHGVLYLVFLFRWAAGIQAIRGDLEGLTLVNIFVFSRFRG